MTATVGSREDQTFVPSARVSVCRAVKHPAVVLQSRFPFYPTEEDLHQLGLIEEKKEILLSDVETVIAWLVSCWSEATRLQRLNSPSGKNKHLSFWISVKQNSLSHLCQEKLCRIK